MLASDWPAAYAHVDADCFFASCEIARDPALRGKPVCVLSSQDACVVAKTYDAKARGITTGMPAWEARKLFPRAIFIPADFGYYGQISDQLFEVLQRYGPTVEICSIDEGYIDVGGLRGLWRNGFGELANHLRTTVQGELGITVSVGVSVTRTLAKMASEFNKPNATTIVAGSRISAFLTRSSLRSIPGIGARREALLQKSGFGSALDLARAAQPLVQRLLGTGGIDLWHELRGTPVFALESEPALPKSISRTASLGMLSSDRALLRSHLAHHTARIATKLALQRLTAGRITVFLRQQSFECATLEMPLPFPTSGYFTLIRAVEQAERRLYRSGTRYRGCGVIVGEINCAASRMPDLFGLAQDDERQTRLMRAAAAINHKYGSGTVRMLAAHHPGTRRRRFRYPLLSLE